MSDEGQFPDDELVALGRRAMTSLPDAPAALRRRAEGIWPRRPGLIQRISAMVSLDSWAAPLPALRSDAQAGRQLLLTTETRDIDLRIMPDGNGWAIEGQVLGPAEDGSVGLCSAGAQIAATQLDDLGSFRLTGLADGRYQLVLYFPTERVELPELEAGPRPPQ